MCLCPRVLCWIRQALRLVVCDILYAEILECFEEYFAYVCESNGTVVWVALLYEHVAIETTHLADAEDADAAEGTCRNVKHLALSDV